MSSRLRASIVAYQTSPDELRRAVETLHAAGVEEVAIVDNSPTAALRPLCEELGADYTPRPDNPGYGAAHNIELRRSLLTEGVEYHLVVNSDVWFEPDTITKIIAYLDAHPETGQLIPRTFYPDGREQEVVRRLPSPADLFVRRFLPKRLGGKLEGRYLLSGRDHSKPLNVPYHQGSFMMLRVDALRRVGLFDERFFMYPEDIDLTRRIHRYYKTMYWPGASIIHAHRAASYKSWRMTWIHLTNMARYFCKWGWIFDAERRRFNRRLDAELEQMSR